MNSMTHNSPTRPILSDEPTTDNRTLTEFTRDLLGLTQHQMARRSGMRVDRLREIEYRLDVPTAEELQALGATFGRECARRWRQGRSSATTQRGEILSTYLLLDGQRQQELAAFAAELLEQQRAEAGAR